MNLCTKCRRLKDANCGSTVTLLPKEPAQRFLDAKVSGKQHHATVIAFNLAGNQSTSSAAVKDEATTTRKRPQSAGCVDFLREKAA